MKLGLRLKFLRSHLKVLFMGTKFSFFWARLPKFKNKNILHTPKTYILTIRYDTVYLTCSKKLTSSQLSPPHGTNKKLKCDTKNKTMSSPVVMKAVRYVKEVSRILWSMVSKAADRSRRQRHEIWREPMALIR